MFEHRDPSGSRYKTYQVEASDFKLGEGDMVRPGVKIGVDIYTKAPLYTDYWGYVATVYYNTMYHSLLVMVCQQSSKDGQADCDQNCYLKQAFL